MITELIHHDTFGWVVPLLMAGVSAYQAIHQNNIQKKEGAKADAAQGAIPMEDPGVRSLADEIRQQRINAQNGQSPMLSYQRRMIDENSRNIGNNAVRAAGSAPGATQQALLRTGQVAQGALAGAGAQAAQQGMQLFGLETPLIQDMADRKLSQQLYSRDSAAFRSAQAGQNSNNAVSSAIGALSGINFDDSTWGSGRAKSKAAPFDVNDTAPIIANTFASPNSAPAGAQEVQGLGNPGVNNPWWQ